jgi:hypothetical protein
MINVGEEEQLIYPAEEEVTPGDGPFHLSAIEKESLMCKSMFELPPNKICNKEITKKELVDVLLNTDQGRDDG